MSERWTTAQIEGAAARRQNGDYSKMFPGQREVDATILADAYLDELPDLRRQRDELLAVLQNLLSAVENMTCPQTVADVGLLMLKFAGPVESARAAIRNATK